MFLLKYGFKFVIALTISALMLCACATFADKRIPMVYARSGDTRAWPDKLLEERFQEYWFDRFAGRVEEAYQIETPYFREMISLGKYNNYVKHTSKNKLVNMEIQEIAKETKFLVNVSCTIQTQVGNDRPVSTQIMDRWVLVGEKWYHIIKDPILLSN
jgi:hypothetical protein